MGNRGKEVLLPRATEPSALRPAQESPGLPTWAHSLLPVLSPRLMGQGQRPPSWARRTSCPLASSISILDLARRSFRSKSRCFCSRSASRSVTCFCRSASFWRSSVIWVQGQRGGCVRAGAHLHSSKLLGGKPQARDQGGPDCTAGNLGFSLELPQPHTTFCSYCCFMDRKCWSHCLFTSSSCRERWG